MLNVNASNARLPGDSNPPSGWRVQCISPNRRIVEELTPVLIRCMPGVSIPDVHPYPEPAELVRMAGEFSGALFFLDAISDQRTALSLIPGFVQHCPGSQVIVLLSSGDPDLLLRCLRLGAAEFLIQPFTPDQLQAALAKLARLLPKERQPAQSVGKVYLVAPAKGACGASTLAVNIAFQWSRLGANRILLADMDPRTGTISFLLKIHSSYSFVDVLAHADKLDADLWKAMVTHRHGVDVLIAPEMLLEAASDLDQASPVIEYARQNYDVVVLDAASVYGPWNLSQARLADELLLVTTNELPALHAAQRALTYLEANRIGRWKTRVIVNRYQKDIGLAQEVISTALQTDIFHVIPSDYDAVQKALLEGKPAPPSSALGKKLAALGDRLAGKEEASPKRNSSFGSLLSLFSRTAS
jgi:pilus assembly protein CpaE